MANPEKGGGSGDFVSGAEPATSDFDLQGVIDAMGDSINKEKALQELIDFLSSHQTISDKDKAELSSLSAEELENYKRFAGCYYRLEEMAAKLGVTDVSDIESWKKGLGDDSDDNLSVIKSFLAMDRKTFSEADEDAINNAFDSIRDRIEALKDGEKYKLRGRRLAEVAVKLGIIDPDDLDAWKKKLAGLGIEPSRIEDVKKILGDASSSYTDEADAKVVSFLDEVEAKHKEAAGNATKKPEAAPGLNDPEVAEWTKEVLEICKRLNIKRPYFENMPKWEVQKHLETFRFLEQLSSVAPRFGIDPRHELFNKQKWIESIDDTKLKDEINACFHSLTNAYRFDKAKAYDLLSRIEAFADKREEPGYTPEVSTDSPEEKRRKEAIAKYVDVCDYYGFTKIESFEFVTEKEAIKLASYYRFCGELRWKRSVFGISPIDTWKADVWKAALTGTPLESEANTALAKMLNYDSFDAATAEAFLIKLKALAEGGNPSLEGDKNKEADEKLTVIEALTSREGLDLEVFKKKIVLLGKKLKLGDNPNLRAINEALDKMELSELRRIQDEIDAEMSKTREAGDDAEKLERLRKLTFGQWFEETYGGYKSKAWPAENFFTAPISDQREALRRYAEIFEPTDAELEAEKLSMIKDLVDSSVIKKTAKIGGFGDKSIREVDSILKAMPIHDLRSFYDKVMFGPDPDSTPKSASGPKPAPDSRPTPDSRPAPDPKTPDNDAKDPRTAPDRPDQGPKTVLDKADQGSNPGSDSSAPDPKKPDRGASKPDDSPDAKAAPDSPNPDKVGDAPKTAREKAEALIRKFGSERLPKTRDGAMRTARAATETRIEAMQLVKRHGGREAFTKKVLDAVEVWNGLSDEQKISYVMKGDKTTLIAGFNGSVDDYAALQLLSSLKVIPGEGTVE